ncbi:hypothetical protein WN943_013564 [Citrus x changshan-huyou]
MSIKAHPCMTRQVTISPTPTLKDRAPSTNGTCDSEPIFFSEEEEIELHDLLNLKDPFWSDQVVNVDGHDQVLTVNKEIKLDSIFAG